MDRATWQGVQELFGAALPADPDTHEDLLKRSGVESEIVETVARMLKAEAADRSFLDSNAADVASHLLLDPEPGCAQPPMDEFGPYRPVRLLGEGGMGVVWLAGRTATGSLVAVAESPTPTG